MSQTQVQRSREASSETQGRSPYPRENYFSSINGEYDHDRETKDPTIHDHSKDNVASGTEKNEWIAKGILRDDATFICPITLHEDPDRCPYDCDTYLEDGECDHESYNLHSENIAVELTDPLVYPPTRSSITAEQTDMQAKSPSSDRWRVNKEYGYLVFGGIIQDRPKDEFLDIVDEVIQSVDCAILDRHIKEARNLARRMKREGDNRDVDILREVVAKILGHRDD